MTIRRPGNLLHDLPVRSISSQDRVGLGVGFRQEGYMGMVVVVVEGLYSRDELPAGGGRRGEAGLLSGGDQGLHGVCPLALSSPDEALREGGRGLDVSGEVERVALQLGEGDGRMLQVVEQHLDLCHDVV